MAQRITIKDIARHLNIHHSTVSRALRNDPKVKRETQKRVADYAQEHGYRVNMNALQLRGEVRNIIAVVVPNVHHFFFSDVVSRIANHARKDGYIVSLFQSNESLEEEKDIINTLIQNNVAGVAVSVSLETRTPEHFKELQKFGIPLVFFDRYCEDIPSAVITVNNRVVVSQAVRKLADAGYSKIAHFTGNSDVSVFRERLAGYREGLMLKELSYSLPVIIDKEFEVSDGKERMAELLGTDNQPDAVIFDSHNLAIGAIVAIREQGLKIPDDIGIYVFGDNPAVDAIDPGISTIVQPHEEIAAECYELLKSQIDNGAKSVSKRVELCAEIVERNSSRREPVDA